MQGDVFGTRTNVQGTEPCSYPRMLEHPNVPLTLKGAHISIRAITYAVGCSALLSFLACS